MRTRTKALVIGAASTALGGGLTIAAVMAGPSASAVGATAAASPIVVNAAVGDTFTPITANSSQSQAALNSGVISEQQALSNFEAQDKDFRAPAGTSTYQLGAYTNPSAGLTNVSVWAISIPGCLPSIGGNTDSASPAPSSMSTSTCVSTWLLLDAHTGRMIQAENQQ